MGVETLNPIRVLIVEPNPIPRAGLRMLVESREGLAVVDEAGTVEDALGSARRNDPDVLLVDLDLGEESVLDLLGSQGAESERWKAVVLTGVEDEDLHCRAVQLGAMAIVLKTFEVETLFTAIQAVAEGRVWLDPEFMARVIVRSGRRGTSGAQTANGKHALLTRRELEVLPLIALGMRNSQIALRMRVSEITVRHYLTSIFGKLGVANRLELAAYINRHRLLDPHL
jgi:DNA-binding NarL/FixJ family response regulator